MIPMTGVLWSMTHGIGENSWVYGDYFPNNSICSCAFVWDGVSPTIETLSAPTGQSRAAAMVAPTAGGEVVVGFAYLNNVPGNPFQVQRAVKWTHQSATGPWAMQDLGTLAEIDAAFSVAYAASINRSEQTTGSSTTVGASRMRAFRTFNQLFIDFQFDNLGTLSDPAASTSWSEGIEINDAGEVVGHSTTSTGSVHIFLKRPAYKFGEGLAAIIHNGDTVMTDLVAGSGSSFRARGINNRGVVIGQAGVTANFGGDPIMISNNSSAFVYLLSLPSSSSMAGWVLQQVYDINDSNRIIGSGTRYGVQRGFMLVPTSPN
jgi:uncharacterized membrane protein